jgi:hypothetical protein
VHLLQYPGLDHSETLTASAPAWLEFLDNQFTRKHTNGASTDKTVRPFDLVVAKTPLELPLNGAIIGLSRLLDLLFGLDRASV